jgi:hypothetical protein
LAEGEDGRPQVSSEKVVERSAQSCWYQRLPQVPRRTFIIVLSASLNQNGMNVVDSGETAWNLYCAVAGNNEDRMTGCPGNEIKAANITALPIRHAEKGLRVSWNFKSIRRSSTPWREVGKFRILASGGYLGDI